MMSYAPYYWSGQTVALINVASDTALDLYKGQFALVQIEKAFVFTRTLLAANLPSLRLIC